MKGNVRHSTEINEGCERVCKLNLEADHVTLVFNTASPVAFKLGDYCDIPGEGRFELTERQQPETDAETGACAYSLRMDAPYMKWRNKIFKYAPNVGGNEAEWNLTAPLDMHLGIFLDNLKALGYNHSYSGKEYAFSIDSSVSDAAKLVSYSNTDLISALTLMAKTWECDVWVEDNIIRFGRCQADGAATVFENGANVVSMTASKSNSEYATRLYVFGSTRNIPANYRPVDEGAVINSVVQKRLMLPEGTPYIDAEEDMPTEQAVEAVVTLDDVYPRTDGEVGSVIPYTDTTEDSEGNKVTETFYRFKEANQDFKFSQDYILEQQELMAVFQSGSLNGMHFSLRFNPEGKKEKLSNEQWNPDAQLFEIVANEKYGRKLPDSTLNPKEGDKYVLYGWDTTKIADLGLIAKAERELLEEGRKVSAKLKVDPNTYECTLFSDYSYGMDSNGKPNASFAKKFFLGDRITLRNPAFFGDGQRTSRIIGYSYPLDKPYDSPKYTIGETAPYSRIADLQQQLETLTLKGKTYTGGAGSPIYVISTKDMTPETDHNVYSALRVLQDFLSKKKDDRSVGKIASDIAVEVGDFVSGVSGGILRRRADGQTELEVDRLWVRVKALFEELTAVRTEAMAGEFLVSPAGGIECNGVTETKDASGNVTGWRCSFPSEIDGEKVRNTFKPGDQARCSFWNAANETSNKVSHKFYWRLVTAVGDGFIELSKDICADNSDIPEAGDHIVQLGKQGEGDDDRKTAIRISTVLGDVPSITLLRDIHTFSLEGCDAVSIGVDATTGRPYLRCYGDMHYGSRDKSGSYLAYDSATGDMEYKGRLNLLSPVGDGTLGDVVAEAGNAGLRLVLSEQAAGVACDAQGNPTGELPTVTATVYRGTAEDTGWDFAASGTGCGVGKLSRNAFRVTSLTADTASVKVTATKAGQPTLRAQVSLYKVRPGADGKPASVYSVEAVPSVLLRKAAGGFNVQSVQVTKYRTTGDAPREATTEKCVHYSFEGADGGGTLIATGAGPSYIIDGIASRIPAEATAVVLELRQDNSATAAVLDTLTVPVLTDAADIEVGGTNLLRDTNQGVRGWTANGSADGLFSLREDVTAGVRAVELVNKAAADNPEWQIAMFLIPDPSVIEPGRQYRLSFDALSAVPGTHLWVNPQQATGKGWLTHERRDVALQTTLTRHVLSFTGKEPVTDNADGAYYMCFTVKPGAARWTEITLCNLKLEQGTVATAYSPSPLDTDYLTRAILDATKENSSFVGGLMLASLLRMGFTDADGTYRVMAGINGIARDKDGKDIALWAGGDMVDAANNTQGLAEFATALIRHNGTAYWCGNRIRFANDHIEVGDSVVLDKDGLRLIDPGTGTVRLSVADVPIGDDFPAVQTAVGIDKETAASIDIARYTPLSLGGGIQAQSWLYVSRGFSYDHPVQSAGQPTLPKGSYLSGKVSAQFDCPLATSDGIITEDIRLDSLEVRLFLEGNDEPVRRWLAPFDIRPYGNTFRFTASATLSHQTEAEGKYTLRVSLPASEQLLGERVTSPTVSVKQTGKVSLGIEGQTVLGRDGLLSVWNGTGGTAAALLVRGDYAGFLVGDHGLRATTGGGFEKTLNGGRKWTPCYFPDKT